MHQWKGLHEYYPMETQDFFFFLSSNYDLWRSAEITFKLRQYQFYIRNWFVNRRSSRLLQHRNPKIKFFQKSSKLNFDLYFDLCWIELKSPYLRQYQSYLSNWYINGKVFTSTTAWKPKNFIFYSKSSKLSFDLCWRAEISLASSISVLHW